VVILQQFQNIINIPMIGLDQLEDCIELDLPVNNLLINLDNLNWVPYNYRKNNFKRFGCSITSLDGNDSGIPDLDSILEYNQIHNTNYNEKDFNKPTKHSTPFSDMLTKFSVGRSHFIKLDVGGFFPWHRDTDNNTFRIIYTIKGCSPIDFVWLENDRIIPLDNSKFYYINTKKKHSVFSFSGSIFAVFNILTTYQNIRTLHNSFIIK
jgi:hypothetical protein